MKIILSIKPEYADKILNGTKKFEFRKTRFSSDVKSIVIYATKPIGKVVGEFEVRSVDIDFPQKIWNKTRSHAGVAKQFFDAYYRDREVAVAIGVGKVQKYAVPVDLTSFGENMTAPQSFRYLSSDVPSPQITLELA